MPIHPFQPMEGEVHMLTLNSKAIANNRLGDPTERQIGVYLPPGYGDSSRDYPLLVDLSGFTAGALHHLGWKSYDGTLPQRVERLVREGKMGPVILAFPDTFTSLGGNQYVNSEAMGNWEDFLILEMVPFIEERFRVRPNCRAVFGKSSGGFGAIYHGLIHGHFWQGLVCHSGDMAFDLCYLPEMPGVLDRLAAFDGSVEKFLNYLDEAPKLKGSDMHVLMTLAMAASYDPDPAAYKGVRLPVDLNTCELISERWERWLAFDPVRIAATGAGQANLGKMAGVFIDCGSKDQYRLHYGSRQLSAVLEKAGVHHRYEEFNDNHSGVDYRMDRSLPFLYEALTRS